MNKSAAQAAALDPSQCNSTDIDNIYPFTKKALTFEPVLLFYVLWDLESFFLLL